MHGGSVRAESVLNAGTIFHVAIPTGTSHLPPAVIADESGVSTTAIGPEPYVAEALRWLPMPRNAVGAQEHEFPAQQSRDNGASAMGGRVLVVDDNAYMREYVARLFAYVI